MERPKETGSSSTDSRYGQEAIHALVIERLLQTSESMKLLYAHKCHIKSLVNVPFCQDEITRALSTLYNKHTQNVISIRKQKTLQDTIIMGFDTKGPLDLTPKYLDSIRSDKPKQGDYCEAQALKHLKQFYRNKMLIDGTKKALGNIGQPGNTFGIPKEEMTKQVTKNLQFYEEIQQIQLKCLELLFKVPCVPVFLKTINGAEIIAALNLLPNYKKAVAKVYTKKKDNKNKSEKPEFGKTTYRLFDQATDYFFADTEFYLSLDEGILVGRFHLHEATKILGQVHSVNSQVVAEEIRSRNSSHKLYMYYMQRLAYKETETCLCKEGVLLNILDYSRHQFREFQTEVMKNELKWITEFISKDNISDPTPIPEIELLTMGVDSDNNDSVEAGKNKMAKQIIYHVTQILLENPKLHRVVSPIPAEYAHYWGAPKDEKAPDQKRPNTVYFEDNDVRPVQFLQRVDTSEMDAKLGIENVSNAFVEMTMSSAPNVAVGENKEIKDNIKEKRVKKPVRIDDF